MQSNLTDVGGARFLEGYFRRVAISPTFTTYLALLTVSPDLSTTPATMAEVGVGGYARQVSTWSVPGGSIATGLTGAVTFGSMAAQVTVTHLALVTSASGTGGSMYAFWKFPAAVTIGAGASFTLQPTDVVLAMNPASWETPPHTSYGPGGLDVMTGRGVTSSLSTRQLALATAYTPGSLNMGATNGITEVFAINTNGYSRSDLTMAPAAGSPPTMAAGAATFGPFTAQTGVITHAVMAVSTTATAPALAAWPLPPPLAREYAPGEMLNFALGDLVARVI